MAQSKPAYVFVGGVSHTPVFFQDLIEQMAAHGYASTAVAFPTCGDNTENTKQWDEVTAIQEAITSYLEGKNSDVVLVSHSYGGWPGSRAVKGLDKETRLKNGKSTGVIEVVFLAGFLLPDNAPMAQFSHLPPWLTVEVGIHTILSCLLALTSHRTAAVSRTSPRFLFSSATWKLLPRSTGSPNSSGTAMISLLKPSPTLLGISPFPRRISSPRMIKPPRLHSSSRCYKVSSTTHGPSRA